MRTVSKHKIEKGHQKEIIINFNFVKVKKELP